MNYQKAKQYIQAAQTGAAIQPGLETISLLLEQMDSKTNTNRHKAIECCDRVWPSRNTDAFRTFHRGEDYFFRHFETPYRFHTTNNSIISPICQVTVLGEEPT